MSKGFLILARNSADVNYVEQAYALALSIKFTQTYNSVSLVTSGTVPRHIASVFDSVISLDSVVGNRYETEVRWQLFHVTPYEETIVLDADMLLLEDVKDWWEYCFEYDLRFCSKVKNYKHELVTDVMYRSAFIANNLPNVYFALHYFKKTDLPLEFYKQLKFVVRNWARCNVEYAPRQQQRWPSMDLASAIAIRMLGIESTSVDQCSPLEFIHMRPDLQGWLSKEPRWQDVAPAMFTPAGDLLVGNIKQYKLFHYIEEDFLTPSIVKKLEVLARGT